MRTWHLLATEKKMLRMSSGGCGNYFNPRKNIPCERYRFNSRQQDPGESFDRYATALRQIADTECVFDAITPDDIQREDYLRCCGE